MPGVTEPSPVSPQNGRRRSAAIPALPGKFPITRSTHRSARRMSQSLSHLVVVEAGGDVAARYCGRLFADHGARVVQCHVPDDARVGRGGLASRAYAAWLDAGKETAAVPPPHADLVIAGQTPGEVARAESLLQGFDARPLLLALTWLGTAGPRAGWQASDGTILAMSGVASGFGEAGGPPMLAQGHGPQVIAGATGFIAALAALLGRERGLPACRIDLSVLQAYLCFTEPAVAAFAKDGTITARGGLNRWQGVYPQTIYPAADGWIGVTALTPPQWQALCEMLGRPELGQDPAFATSDLRFQASATIDALLAPELRKRARAELLEEGQRRRIPLAPMPAPAEVFTTPHWRERGSFRGLRIDGRAFEGPAAPFRVRAHGASSTHGSTQLPGASPAPSNAPAGRAQSDAPAGPLSGLRVLDLSMGWSGPLAGRHLADLGADVIKVESCSHMDWWRGWDALQDGDPPPHEIRSIFNANNRNKRGITLDLRDPRGVALLRRLAARSDVLLENFAPGVLDRLGLSAAALAEVAPQLVYVSMGAFGQSGPWSGFRAYGSTTEQASSFPMMNGEPHWPPAMQHGAYGDATAGVYAALAALVGVHGRRHAGGAHVDLSQVECLFQLAADGLVAQSATGEAPARIGPRSPTSAWRGVLRCAGEDAWIAVEIVDAATLPAQLRAAGIDGLRGAAPGGAPDEAVTAALQAWTRDRAPLDACETLQRAGIAAAPVHSPHTLLHDEHLVHAGFWQRIQRRHVGEHVVPKPPYDLDGRAPGIRAPAPTLGEHNADVLAEVLGLDAAEIATLARDGIIGTRPV